eukprot:TRINITY_DN3103_c3_g4_i1.p1 TRINITY_DN3103_c3_g4~~TRINITY_DN3103_c3_g4_i1.p1  ORF type:complete len:227 (+),score=87.67 TRINITY_DN3103_c3_g4_i1:77-682(+)
MAGAAAGGANGAAQLGAVAHALVGKRVKFQVQQQEVEGVVYVFDPADNCIAIFEPGQGPKARQTVRIFNLSYVQNITQVGEAMHELHEALQPRAQWLPKLQHDKIAERATASAEKRQKSLGADVTVAAQDCFDAISRTLPCTWDGTDIRVLDVLRLSAPYTIQQLKKAKEEDDGRHDRTFDQVRKILSDREAKHPTGGKGK